jgi:hypothetical protein
VETGKLGSKINPAGVCIKPPPPTMASIKPAAKAAIQSNMIIYVSIDLYDELQKEN